MGKRKAKPPAPWAWALSAVFLVTAVGVVLSPLFVTYERPDPNARWREALKGSRVLTILKGSEGMKVRSIEDAAEIEKVIASIKVVPGPKFRWNEPPRYLLKFDQIEVHWVAEGVLRAPFWDTDFRLDEPSVKFLESLVK